MNEDILKMLLDMYNNPLFKKGFHDFFMKMQNEGADSARNFWNFYPERDKLFSKTPDIFELMIDFYSNMGFVPRKMYEDVVKEKEVLKKENQFLKDMIAKLNLKIMTEGGEKVQEAWKSTVEKQMEVSKEMAKNFFELFKQSPKKE